MDDYLEQTHASLERMTNEYEDYERDLQSNQGPQNSAGGCCCGGTAAGMLGLALGALAFGALQWL